MKLLPCLLLLVGLFSCSREQKPENRVAASFHAEELAQDFKLDLSKRQVFPYSVVPGGTVTRDEVKAKVATDPVVRQHYQDIQVDKLKPFRLTKPAQGYVSYRIGNRIFWTAQRLYLKPGEILLSDGANLIRGRCGNRISITAQEPLQPAGAPPQAVLDLPSWDLPVFQAMAQEANRPASEPPLFTLPGNGPEPLLALSAKIPESVFTVVPPVIGPGPIGGGLPGGLPPSGKDGEIILINPLPFLYVFTQPITIPPPGILLPSITPIEVAGNQFPPILGNIGSIGIGGPVFYFNDNPLIPSSPAPPVFYTPPVYLVPPIFVAGGNPPLIYIPPTSVLPPGESNPPPPAGGPGNPTQTEPPLVFQPIPEPSTAGMVLLAAVLVYLLKLKRTPSLLPVPCRSSGGRPLR